MEQHVEEQDTKEMTIQLIRKVEELQRAVAAQTKQLDEIETRLLRDGSTVALTNMKITCMEGKIKRLYEDRFGSRLDEYKREYLNDLRH